MASEAFDLQEIFCHTKGSQKGIENAEAVMKVNLLETYTLGELRD